jgi:anti-sigma factor RsiW
MTENQHRHWQSMLGAYALDQLSPQERADVDAHLATCSQCSAALQEVMPMARLLPMANPRRVVNKPRVRPEVAESLFAKIGAEKRQQRRVRYATSSITAVAAAVLVAVLVVPTVSPSQPGEGVTFVATPASVKAEGRIVDEQWGSEIRLTVAGLSGRQTVWFEQPDGTRASAGSFEGGNGEEVKLVLSTAFKSKDAVALCVSPPNAPPVLRAPLSA